jgi:hypothetical protein
MVIQASRRISYMSGKNGEFDSAILWVYELHGPIQISKSPFYGKGIKRQSVSFLTYMLFALKHVTMSMGNKYNHNPF